MNESKLPKGFTDKEWEQGTWGYMEALPEPKISKKCDCGAWKTFGNTCGLEYHYDWCELKENKND